MTHEDREEKLFGSVYSWHKESTRARISSTGGKMNLKKALELGLTRDFLVQNESKEIVRARINT